MAVETVTVELWAAVLKMLQASYPVDHCETWFNPLRARSGEDGALELVAGNEFAAIWVEDNFLEVIGAKVRELAGAAVEVRVVCEEQPEAVADAEGRVGANRIEEAEARTGRRAGVGVGRGRDLGGGGERRNGAKLNPRNTFENFIVGPSNQLAHAAATAVASAPGSAFNPLFVYGETGLGKTHLMHAIAHGIQAQNPSARVVYLSCEKFTNKFLTAIREASLDSFRRFYRKVDVLIIDDVQFLEGKERTQEEFFHTFNELYETQRQLCLTSDRPVTEIGNLEGRLVSRFQWGMIADIQAPDLETRVAILKKKAAAMGYGGIPEAVYEYLASRISRNVRRLEGALLKVAMYGRLTKVPLTTRIVEDLVHDILQEETQQQITIGRIQKKVAEYYDIRLADMLSKRRPSNIAFPRQIAMYLSRILTAHPLKEIGDNFGGRDHGTVIHACKTVENYMEQDETVRRNIEYLTRQLNGGGGAQ